MKEIIWYGRGGQGAFTAARLLGIAFMLQGDDRWSLAFPTFGPERRGALVRAFTKLDSRPVRDRSQSEKADVIVYLDETLFSADAAAALLKEGGRILLNSRCAQKEEEEETTDFADYADEAGHIRITPVRFDGSGMAMKLLHRPITNTVMLGALGALLATEGERDVWLTSLEGAINQGMSPRLREPNIAAMREAFAAVSGGAR
jgi:pyruvate ferredoxin oxidoreductase gamma subunit